jgi:hypothetical protein
MIEIFALRKVKLLFADDSPNSPKHRPRQVGE